MKISAALPTLVVLGTTIGYQSAFAQSSVTLYGIADTSVRYLTNADSANNNKLSLTNGAISNSRWGVKGTEDLGGGLSAIFRLESGINLQDGTGSDSQRLFNRYAYVGLSSAYGTLTLGRQTNVLFDLLGSTYDPLTVGNYFENAWLPYALASGLYADNAIKYAGTLAGLSMEAMYSFGTNFESTGASGFSGQVPGHLGAGNQYGLTLSYTAGPVSIGAAFQQTSDNSSRKQTVFNVNAVYAFSTVKLFAGYLYGKDDTGFVDSALAQRNLVLGTDILPGSGRKDSAPFTGITWQATPALALTGAGYYDHMQNAAIGGGDVGSGNRYTLVALAEYSLSKATQVYGTVDFNHVSGAADVELPGRDNQTGLGVGIRHVF